MDGSSNNSFIPKRGPVNRPRKVASQQVYLFTLISYVLFFATLVATAGVFFYGRYIDSQFETEVSALSIEIDRFNDTDLNNILTFDKRLKKVVNRVNNSVSLATVFEALEKSTVKTAQFEDFKLSRLQDESFELIASIKTDDFDSSIFQREVFEQNNVIDSVEISELAIEGIAVDEGQEITNLTDSSQISLTARLSVPVSAVPFVPNRISTQPVEVVEEVVDSLGSSTVSTATSSDELELDNQIDL